MGADNSGRFFAHLLIFLRFDTQFCGKANPPFVCFLLYALRVRYLFFLLPRAISL